MHEFNLPPASCLVTTGFIRRLDLVGGTLKDVSLVTIGAVDVWGRMLNR